MLVQRWAVVVLLRGHQSLSSRGTRGEDKSRPGRASAPGGAQTGLNGEVQKRKEPFCDK